MICKLLLLLLSSPCFYVNQYAVLEAIFKMGIIITHAEEEPMRLEESLLLVTVWA